ncbi:YoaK family protein [Bacillus pumilus]|uniref:YoaK family protein n=1 Tax=Bacillus pumilus TaxID=1408 RepID=UPI0011A34F24|nr:YoaK family protein [Bacillus pumilus]
MTILTAHSFRNIALIFLCLSAGIVDVIGYLSLGHVFTANMTGNIVLLGIAAGSSLQLTALHSITALSGFVLGVLLAVVIGGKHEKTFWPKAVTRIFIIEVIILLLFALMTIFPYTQGAYFMLIILLSMAMGLQTAAARKLNVAGISTTVLTSTLANLFEDLAQRISHREKRKAPIEHVSFMRIGSIVFYCLGAALAAYTDAFDPFIIIWLPISILGVIVITAAIKHFHQLK